MQVGRKNVSRLIAALAVVALTLGIVAPFGQAQAPRKTIMVVDFVDRTGTWWNTREVITTRVISKLRDDQTLRVVPRDRVQAALQEAKVERAGIIDWEDAQKVAKTLEADYVLMGEVTVFDQQRTGGCVPIVGCAYTDTASVGLHGKVLKVATGQFVGEPAAEVKKQQGSGSISGVPGLGGVTVENIDSQLIGKAALEAVEKFVAATRPKFN